MSFLSELLESTGARVAEARALVSEEVLEQRVAAAEPPRRFAAALTTPATAVIAEIKRATPSRGDLDLDLDTRKLAAAYRDGGAAAISVLTEPDRFKGSLEDLAAAREVGLPVLRKDFIIDPWQILEARAWGADAVLLIVRINGDEFETLVKTTASLGMDALVEVYDENDLERAAVAGASLIGINNRDLETFEVDPDRTRRLAPLVPDGATVVALSGVTTRPEVEALAAAGADAVLVGESLVTAEDPAAKLRELTGA
ncbi:MAG: indole-3-glycerol phosphate synthase TrpC [Actinomycetota bacterium]